MSAAKAITDHMRDWVMGNNNKDEIISMGILSDGSYGVKKGIIFSFPIIIKNGKIEIVQNLSIDDFSKKKWKLLKKNYLKKDKLLLNFLEFQKMMNNYYKRLIFYYY